jgi:hypothetical protein
MPRARERVCLESGLRLDINRLARRGFISPGSFSGPVGIRWTDTYGEAIASGIIAADMSGPIEGWFQICIGDLDQRITLVARRRHFGGRQWFFVCPYLNQRATVLWRPPGAHRFACRQRWGRQVAYASQFCSPIDRAHQGKARINQRLRAIGGFDPDEWDLAPKPKWMRWSTYNRAVEKFDRYEEILDYGAASALARLMAR